jgi:hypothetical protein
MIARPPNCKESGAAKSRAQQNPGLKKRFLENKNIIIMYNMKIAVSSSDCGIDSEVV